MRPFQRSPKSIGLLVVMFIVSLVLAACGSQAGASGFSDVGDELAEIPVDPVRAHWGHRPSLLSS